MESNEVLDKLPAHLMSLVIEQPYDDYTAQDHAVWRYIMRQNVRFLPGVAHESYLTGLALTGISIDRIPRMYGMNRILKDIGWAAVAVDGFIPPSAFMEFQAHHVLVIAADIRPITQIGYTPAPDIVHEAAGHAPIIAHPEYADYLVSFGTTGSKAFSSRKDFEIYEAIRLLSILKADPYTPQDLIRRAGEHLEKITAEAGERSELARLRNLHWWTVEYGLIGDLQKPRIYGAGLLSSISESYNCLRDGVKKLPYTIDAAMTDFDITTQQPQLFVTPDFRTLTRVLEEFTSTLAVRQGGIEGLRRAADSGQLATVVFSSGIQVSGPRLTFMEKNGMPAYIRFSGASAMAFRDKELPGQGKTRHPDGFGTPAGRLKNINTPPELLSMREVYDMEDKDGYLRLEFESGMMVRGKVDEIFQREGRILFITLDDCTVNYQGDVLFRREWGKYDMAIGSEIVSVHAGPADPDAYGISYPVIKEKTHRIVYGPEEQRLHGYYGNVRELRETGAANGRLRNAWQAVRTEYPGEWLLPLEILELIREAEDPAFHREVLGHLLEVRKDPGLTKLVDDGLALIR